MCALHAHPQLPGGVGLGGGGGRQEWHGGHIGWSGIAGDGHPHVVLGGLLWLWVLLCCDIFKSYREMLPRQLPPRQQDLHLWWHRVDSVLHIRFGHHWDRPNYGQIAHTVTSSRAVLLQSLPEVHAAQLTRHDRREQQWIANSICWCLTTTTSRCAHQVDAVGAWECSQTHPSEPNCADSQLPKL